MQMLYLNNHGTRWVILDDSGKRERIELTTKSGKSAWRTVNFYEQFGNFCTANISWKGKKINIFPNETLLDD